MYKRILYSLTSLGLTAGMLLTTASCYKHYEVSPTVPRVNINTPTWTGTRTWTPTTTWTITSTYTHTSSFTPTPTFTHTSSLPPTSTSTATRTQTIPPPPTNTHTRSWTPTSSYSPTSTSSPVPSATATDTFDTPTATFTGVDTDTATVTATFTATDTIGTGDTPTDTATPTDTIVLPCAPSQYFGYNGTAGGYLANANYLEASPYTLSEPGTILSLSVPLSLASGNVQVAVYADNAGAPGTLVLASSEQAAVDGWNTVPLTPMRLDTGVYWLAVQVQDTTQVGGIAPGASYWVGLAYGAFPDPFTTGNPNTSYSLILYACYDRDASVPTNTPTFSPTETLSPTETGTPTDTLTPTDTIPPPCDPTYVFGGTDAGMGVLPNANYLEASPYTLSEPGTIFSMGISLTTVSGNVALAVYADDAGVPGALLVASADQAAVEGLNTVPVTPTLLSSGIYWLAVQVQNATQVWGTTDDIFSPRASYWANMAYGAYPDPFGPGTANTNYRLLLWANYCRDASAPTNTPTLSPTITDTPTSTPTPSLLFVEVTPTTAFPGRDTHQSLVFDDGTGSKMWVIAGMDTLGGVMNDVWNSTDGSSWNIANSTAAFPARNDFSALTYDDGTGEKMWVVGGWSGSAVLGDVWNSSDGVTWNQVTVNTPYSARDRQSMAVFDGGTGLKMWMIGGWDGTTTLGDVWSSADGVDWNQNANVTSMGLRAYGGCLVYNNRLWIIAGFNGSGPANDVWSSADGVNWVQETAAAAFPTRYGHTVALFDDGAGLRMWVLGGFSGSGFLADVWSSSDGVNWTMENGAAFPARAGLTSEVYNNRLWAIAGFTASGRVNTVFAAP